MTTNDTDSFEINGWRAEHVQWAGKPRYHSGPGWYVWSADYPDEGSTHFKTRQEAVDFMNDI